MMNTFATVGFIATPMSSALKATCHPDGTQRVIMRGRFVSRSHMKGSRQGYRDQVCSCGGRARPARLAPPPSPKLCLLKLARHVTARSPRCDTKTYSNRCMNPMWRGRPRTLDSCVYETKSTLCSSCILSLRESTSIPTQHIEHLGYNHSTLCSSILACCAPGTCE